MVTVSKKLLYAANPVLEMPMPEHRQFDITTEEGRQSQKRQERYFERFHEFRFAPAFIPIEIVVSGYWDELGPFPQTILGMLINNNRPALQMVDELGCIIPATEERQAWAKKYLRKCAEKPRLRWASSLRVNSGIGWLAEELMQELFEPEEIVTGENSTTPALTDTITAIDQAPTVAAAGESVASNPATCLVENVIRRMISKKRRVTLSTIWVELGELVGKSIIEDSQPGRFLCNIGSDDYHHITKDSVRGILGRWRARLKHA